MCIYIYGEPISEVLPTVPSSPLSSLSTLLLAGKRVAETLGSVTVSKSDICMCACVFSRYTHTRVVIHYVSSNVRPLHILVTSCDNDCISFRFHAFYSIGNGFVYKKAMHIEWRNQIEKSLLNIKNIYSEKNDKS